MRSICFTSDYGLTEDLVGLCKGVMAGIAPVANIVDVAHDVRSFDVLQGQGAEPLRHATRYGVAADSATVEDLNCIDRESVWWLQSRRLSQLFSVPDLRRSQPLYVLLSRRD